MPFDAIVIGGGCAGFAAATALVEAGARVLVVEARPGLGGRATAFTDPATGERYHVEAAGALWNPPPDLKVSSAAAQSPCSSWMAPRLESGSETSM